MYRKALRPAAEELFFIESLTHFVQRIITLGPNAVKPCWHTKNVENRGITIYSLQALTFEYISVIIHLEIRLSLDSKEERALEN